MDTSPSTDSPSLAKRFTKKQLIVYGGCIVLFLAGVASLWEANGHIGAAKFWLLGVLFWLSQFYTPTANLTPEVKAEMAGFRAEQDARSRAEKEARIEASRSLCDSMGEWRGNRIEALCEQIGGLVKFLLIGGLIALPFFFAPWWAAVIILLLIVVIWLLLVR